MSDAPEDIRCMMLPLHVGCLVLPNETVAEIIGYREPDPIEAEGVGVQGKVTWRQREVPLIDFERFMGAGEQPPSIRQRIAICYTPDPEAGRPLIGLVSQGIPRLLRIEQNAIEDATEGPHGDSAIKMRIKVGGETLTVPDIVYLQSRLG